VPLPAGLGAPAGAVRGGGSRPTINPGLLGHGRAGTNGLPVATAGALPAGLLPTGLDSGDAAKFGTPLTVVGGVGAGLTMHAIVQYYRHAVRRVESLSPGVWGDVVPSTRSGREALTVSRLRAARNLEGLGKPLNPLKTFGKASIVLEPISAYATFKGNEGHMSTAENVTRTGFSTAGGIVFGGLAGGLCAMSGVGTIATGGCGALGAIGGSWLGDKTGAVAYDVGDFAYSDVAKPVWNGGVKPAWNATGGALIHAVGG
jgi:hypothetical protein